MKAVRRTAVQLGIVRVLALVGILGLFGAGCKSPTSPRGSGEADISITNDHSDVLNIYVDGTFKFALRYRTTIEIDDVELYHEYSLEAREPATGQLIDVTLIDVQTETDYGWTINPPPRIKVTNNWSQVQGEKLAVSMDGVFKFDLERGEIRMIMQVDYGEHFLEAVNLSTGKPVASTSFQIQKNDTYEWDIAHLSPS